MSKNFKIVSKKLSRKILAFFLVFTLVFSANVFDAMKIVYANETESNKVVESITNENLLMNEVKEEENSLDEDKNIDIENEELEEEPEEKINLDENEEVVDEEPEEEINVDENEEELVEEEPEEEINVDENEEVVEEEPEEEINVDENEEVVEEEPEEEINVDENEKVVEEKPEEKNINVEDNEEVEENKENNNSNNIISNLDDDNKEETDNNKEFAEETIVDDKKEENLNELNKEKEEVNEEELKIEIKEKKILNSIQSNTYYVINDWAGEYDVSPSQTEVHVDFYSNNYCTLTDSILSGWLVENLDLQLGKPKQNGYVFNRWDVYFDPSSLVWNNTSGDGETLNPADIEYLIGTDNEGNNNEMVGVPIDTKYAYVSGDFVITATPIWLKRETYNVNLEWPLTDFEIAPTKTDVDVDYYSNGYCDLIDDYLSGWLTNLDLHLGKPQRTGYVFKKWDVFFDDSSVVWNPMQTSEIQITDTDDEGNRDGVIGFPIMDTSVAYVSGDLVITAKPLWSKTYTVDTSSWTGDYEINATQKNVQVDIYSGNYYEDMDATLSGWLIENAELHLGKPMQDGYVFEKWIVNLVDNFVWNPTQDAYNDDCETDNDGNYSGTFARELDANVVENGGDLTITAEPQWSKKIYEIALNDNGGSGGDGVIYEWHTQGKYSDNECNNAITSVTPPTKIDDEFQGYFFNGTKYINENGTFTADFTNDAFSDNVTLDAHWTNSSSGNTWTETIHVNKLWSGDYELPGTNDIINFTFKSGYPDANANGWVTDHYQLVLGKAKQDGYWLNGWNIDWFDNTVWNPSVDPMEIHGDFANDEGKNDGSRDRNLNANTTYVSGSIDIKATPNWRKKIWGIHLEDNGGSGGDGIIYEWHTKGIYKDNECNTTTISSVKVPTKSGYEFLGYYFNNTQYIDKKGKFTSKFTGSAFNEDTHLKAEWKTKEHHESSGGGGSSGGSGFVSTNANSIKTWGTNGTIDGAIVFDEKTQSYRNALDGTAVTNQWIGKPGLGNTVVWYYVGGSSQFSKGWQNLNGSLYYFDERGVMLTGKQVIDGVEYYFSDAVNGEQGKLVFK